MHEPESLIELQVRRHSWRVGSQTQSLSAWQAAAVVYETAHVVLHVWLTCMHWPLSLQSVVPVSTEQASLQVLVVASHWQAESAVQSVWCFAYDSLQDDVQALPSQRQALNCWQSDWTLPAQLSTQLPSGLTVHVESELHDARLLQAGLHELTSYWQAGLRVQVPWVPLTELTWSHLVKHVRRLLSHWQRESAVHESCDGYWTEHCMTHLPVRSSSQTALAAQVVADAIVVQAARHVAPLLSHKHSGSLAQAIFVVRRNSQDVWHPLPPALYWHKPLPTQAASLVYVVQSGAQVCFAESHWHELCATQ